METEKIIEEITPLFRKVLDNDSIVLKRETTANDVEEWDSLTHILVVVAIEKHFKIKFNASEIQRFKNVGEMCDSIASKVS